MKNECVFPNTSFVLRVLGSFHNDHGYYDAMNASAQCAYDHKTRIQYGLYPIRCINCKRVWVKWSSTTRRNTISVWNDLYESYQRYAICKPCRRMRIHHQRSCYICRRPMSIQHRVYVVRTHIDTIAGMYHKKCFEKMNYQNK